MKILIVEDSRDIAANIADYLEPLGHDLDFAISGPAGLQLATQFHYDVIVLDVMLPGMDGIAVCQEIRKSTSKEVPVIMLTARDQLEDKLIGFSAGADDYLVKPFSIKELEARLHALVDRKDRRDHCDELTVGPLNYNLETLKATRAGQELDLNPVQRKILLLLMKNTHRVVSREELEQQIWGEDRPDSDILRTHIYSLRNIIDKPYPQKLLHTAHGVGYRLTLDSDD